MATSSTSYLAPSLKDQGYIGVTGTTPYRSAIAEQVMKLQEQYNNSFIPEGPVAISAKAIVLRFNFDGTKDNGAPPAPGEVRRRRRAC